MLLGPSGAALDALLGLKGGMAIVVLSMLTWCVGPIGLAQRIYRRRDF